jgi:hypothetical protein
MAKGGKLSFKSIVDCFKSAKSDSDRVSCKKHFQKKLLPQGGTAKDYDPLWAKGRLKKGNYPKGNIFHKPKPMNKKESKVWSKYIGQGSLARSRMNKSEKATLDSLIKDKLKRLED